MKTKNKMFNARNNTIIAVIMMCVVLFTVFAFSDDKELQKEVVQEITNTITDMATYEMSDEDVANLATTEIIEQTEEQENKQEQEVEDESFKLQGEIAYEGTSEYPQVSLGEYKGLTYYSQIDSRWSNKMYSSTGNSSQTIGTSGCGPTSASMIVTAIKGAITPDVMSDLFVKYGYRSANNGTYLSAFRFVADTFDIEYKETYKLDEAVELLRNNHYLVVSVNNGLFTTGGHLMTIVGVEGNELKIYDPYLYAGKFETATRRGKVRVEGNTVYCSIDNFRNYANYNGFYAYKHDGNVEINNNQHVVTQSYVRYVNAKTGLNVRNAPGGRIIGALVNNTKVNVYETSGSWSKIDQGWVASQYLATSISYNTTNTAGQTRKLKACYLYEKSNLTGKVYTYKANTTVTILQNVSSNVDKVRVNLTDRIAYINTSNYSNSTTNKNTVNQTKRLKACTLYSKSNLRGVRYQYKDNTSVVILQNVNANVDKIRVRLTDRIAYVNNKNYK